MGRKSVSGGVREERGKIRLDFRFRGQRLKPVLALAWNERNRRAALRLMESIRIEIRNGVFDPAAHFPEYGGLARVGSTRPRIPTFLEQATTYLECINLADSTRTSYANTLKTHWYPAIGSMLVSVIRPSDIRSVVKNLSPKTHNNVLIPCRGVLQSAVDDEIIGKSPAGSVKDVKLQKAEPDPYSLKEVEQILKDLRRQHGPDIADYFEFAFFTGLRVSEQIALEWRDFDKARALLTVARARVNGKTKVTKTSRVRHLELLGRAQAVLSRQYVRTGSDGGAIFLRPSTGRPWPNQNGQHKLFAGAISRTKLRYRSQKQTRHTFATMCLMAGANPAWVAAQLGHVSAKMLFEVYSKWIVGADDGLQRRRVESWIGPQLGRK